MTPLDAELVRRKLVVIERNLAHLAGIENLSLEEYQSDFLRRKATERVLQEIVKAAADVNLHLIREAGGETPRGHYETFIAVGREKIVDYELAQALAPSGGLRNRLVHEYDEIDDAIVLEAVAEVKSLFHRYAAEIERHLTAAGF